MITPSTIFAGGLIAAVAAGWNQVKSLFNKLTTLFLVEVNLQQAVAAVVYEHLRSSWKEPPTGSIHLFEATLRLKNGSRRPIPFRMSNYRKFKIFYRGREFLFICVLDERIRYIRGCLDLNALVKEAYLQRYNLLSVKEQGNRSSRFFASQRFGPVSEMARQQMFTRKPQQSGETSESPVKDSESYLTDHRIEDPVFHDRSEFQDEIRSDPLRGRYFSPEQKALLDDAVLWVKSEDWYAEHSLPWRRGWLTFGPPGTGKSTLAEYAARLLGVPLYVYHLKTYDDPSFHQDWAQMERPCVALFDDFDATFEGRKPTDPETKLTFDCLLNVLSGPGELSNGVLTVFTTNKPETLDPALASPRPGAPEAQMVSRPGRIDRVLELGYINLDQATKVIQLVTRDSVPDLEEALRRLKTNAPLDKLTPIIALDAARGVLQEKLSAA